MLVKKLDKTEVAVADVTVVDYYVNHVSGSDENSGDEESPFETIGQAVKMIEGSADEHIEARPVENHVYNIHIIGDYITESQLNFSGILHRINIISDAEEPDGRPCVIIGEVITGYTQSDGVVSFTTENYPSSVIINGHVLEMNKSCDLHYPTEIYVPSVTPTLVVGSDSGGLSSDSLYIKIKVPSGLNLTLSGEEVFMYYIGWRTFSSYIAAVIEGYFYVECPSRVKDGEIIPYWENFSISDLTFRILNNESFDGGYYFTKEGNEYSVFVPFSDTVESLAIPTANENIKIDNCLTLRLYNLKFIGSKFRTINTLQASANAYCAIMIEGSANIIIDGCEFEGTYGYSVGIGNNCHGCLVENNYFHDLLGGAVHISSSSALRNEDAKDNSYERSGNNDAIKPDGTHVNDNLIKGFGRIDSNCCGILNRFSKNNVIEHNTICDGFYSGIASGYLWHYGNDSTKHNHIAYNHVHHCMQGVTSDGGGIYTLAQQEGTIIEHNKIHDIYAKVSRKNANGIYLDQATSELIIRYNLVYGCDRNLMVHYGRCNKVFNNLLAYDLYNSVICRTDYAESGDYNFLTLLSNLIINNPGKDSPETEFGNTVIGNTIEYINTLTNSPSVFEKLSKSYQTIRVLRPPFANIEDGDFSWELPDGLTGAQIYSESMDGVYKFYIGFLKERFGVTSLYLRSKEALTGTYTWNGTQYGYDDYYRNMIKELTGVNNEYLAPFTDD